MDVGARIVELLEENNRLLAGVASRLDKVVEHQREIRAQNGRLEAVLRAAHNVPEMTRDQRSWANRVRGSNGSGRPDHRT